MLRIQLKSGVVNSKAGITFCLNILGFIDGILLLIPFLSDTVQSIPKFGICFLIFPKYKLFDTFQSCAVLNLSSIFLVFPSIFFPFLSFIYGVKFLCNPSIFTN